eukprot:jgi/Mesen1/1655/ME000135S00656
MGLAYDSPVQTIDLSLGEQQAAAALRKACTDVGFFYLVNHGVEMSLLQKVFNESRKFFELSVEEKLKVVQDKNNRGYTPFLEEILDPARQSKGDTKEGYYIGKEVPHGDPRSEKPLHGPNQWPDPGVLPEWRPAMEEYFARVTELGMQMLRLLALALELDPAFFLQPGRFDDPMVFLRLLHYSAERSEPESGVFGAGAHSDYGMLTFLVTDGVPGLQICRKKDEHPQTWEDVLPLEGAFIVNIGDMLERWSNNLFRSTLHRVVSSGRERYSVPVFFEPDFDCLVECLPSCCSPENPARYQPVTSGEYLLGRYRDTHSTYKERECGTQQNT